ncbi:hypothetical protein D3C76_1488630 [compost metagenome]
MNDSGLLRPVRSLTVPLTTAMAGLLALSTAMLSTPWFLLRTRPVAAATSGVSMLEVNAL